MKFTYAIMAHNAPAQLHALIDRLAAGDGQDRIILHLDKRSALWREQRDEFARHPSGKVELVSHPAAVRWAHHSIVVAQHRLLQTALQGEFDYFHLISGADWPVVDRARMAADIAAHTPALPAFTHIFGQMQEARMQDWWFDERKFDFGRYRRLAVNVERAQTRASWAFSRWWNRAGLHRRLYRGQPWIKGSGWFSLPRDIAAEVSAELGKLLRGGRLRFTQCADEHAVPTILSRLHGDRIAGDRRYIDWAAGGYHPKLLTRADKAAIAASGAWFARKFDSATDDFFLDPAAFSASGAAAE